MIGREFSPMGMSKKTTEETASAMGDITVSIASLTGLAARIIRLRSSLHGGKSFFSVS